MPISFYKAALAAFSISNLLVLGLLGYDYIYVGHGLEPHLAFVLAIVVTLGWFAGANIIERIEDHGQA
jgi:hypothetical protein